MYNASSYTYVKLTDLLKLHIAPIFRTPKPDLEQLAAIIGIASAKCTRGCFNSRPPNKNTKTKDRAPAVRTDGATPNITQVSPQAHTCQHRTMCSTSRAIELGRAVGTDVAPSRVPLARPRGGPATASRELHRNPSHDPLSFAPGPDDRGRRTCTTPSQRLGQVVCTTPHDVAALLR
jgi:hypothetical protein